MSAKAERYVWECPECGKAYRVRVGQKPPSRCPACRKQSQTSYRVSDMPDPPEWMRRRVKQKSAFVETNDRRKFHQDDEPEPIVLKRTPLPATPPERKRPATPPERKPLPREPARSSALLAFGGGYVCWCIAWVVMTMSSDAVTDDQRLITLIAAITLVPLAIACYMLPTIIAYSRKHHNALPIGVINVVFGWTLVGYVGVLAWALSSPAHTEVHHYHHT